VSPLVKENKHSYDLICTCTQINLPGVPEGKPKIYPHGKTHSSGSSSSGSDRYQIRRLPKISTYHAKTTKKAQLIISTPKVWSVITYHHHHHDHHILFPRQTDSKHNQAARKSQDRQSWLPIITTQIWNYAISKIWKREKNRENLKMNVCRMVQTVQLV